MTRVLLIVLALGTVIGSFLIEDEPQAFGRIRDFSTKLKRRAMEAAAATLAEDQAAERQALMSARPDLLADHGSWDATAAVRHVFALPRPESPTTASAATPANGALLALTADPGPSAQPAGAASPPDEHPLDDDGGDERPAPPEHHVTLVMLGEGMARAVVDAAVVGLGDRIGDEVLVQVHAHGVVLRGEHGLVAYDVGHARGRRLADDALRADTEGGRR